MQTKRHVTTHIPRAQKTRRRRKATTLLLLSLTLQPAQALSQGAARRTPPSRPVSADVRPAPADVSAGSVGVPFATLLALVRAEDERRWDESEFAPLLSDKRAAVRRRAALAAGRIGNEGAVARLTTLLRADADEGVRATAAFALGEIESDAAADVLIASLRTGKSVAERARAFEALGKIAAALPATQEERRKSLGEAILAALAAEQKGARSNNALVLAGLTAVLRARPAGAGEAVAPFLSSADARVRADAANTLSRLRAKTAAAKLRELLTGDPDAVVRSNAARALGAAEDVASLDALAARAAADTDQRVRISAVRALAQLKDARAVEPLVKRAETLFAPYRAAKTSAETRPPETNELLEIAAALGRLLPPAGNERALTWLRQFREAENFSAPEVEVALAHVLSTQYLREPPLDALAGVLGGKAPRGRAASLKSWQSYSAVAQGLAEIASASSAAGGNSAVSLKADAQMLLLALLGDPATPALAVPDVLRALAAFKSANHAETLRAKLTDDDVIVRATAADLLGELDPDPTSARALAAALPRALSDKLNDAALSIVGALARQKTNESAEAIRTALAVPDYVVRRRAAALLKEMGRGGSAAESADTVATQFKEADYRRALGRTGRSVRARVLTDKGAFTMELLPDEAPMNVDNFVELARRGYFNGVMFHRVVPNFVVQGGDPRGDGNGGPGYQIRCEVNAVPYGRGAVGMALSGKDTGGSQWFVTHAPQPHLDGGYTVFGRVVEGMDVVDRTARGDRITGVTVIEGKPPATGTERPTGRKAKP
ncbi:MAG TPA: peptidylprolyl isomerase [Pyrinomonadaceae bacterium]